MSGAPMFTSKIVHLYCRKVCIILLGRNWCTSWIPNHRHAWYFFGMRHGSGCIEYWCLKRLRPKPLCRGNLQHLKTIAGGGAIWNSLCWSKGWETLPISLPRWLGTARPVPTSYSPHLWTVAPLCPQNSVSPTPSPPISPPDAPVSSDIPTPEKVRAEDLINCYIQQMTIAHLNSLVHWASDNVGLWPVGGSQHHFVPLSTSGKSKLCHLWKSREVAKCACASKLFWQRLWAISHT